MITFLGMRPMTNYTKEIPHVVSRLYDISSDMTYLSGIRLKPGTCQTASAWVLIQRRKWHTRIAEIYSKDVKIVTFLTSCHTPTTCDVNTTCDWIRRTLLCHSSKSEYFTSTNMRYHTKAPQCVVIFFFSAVHFAVPFLKPRETLILMKWSILLKSKLSSSIFTCVYSLSTKYISKVWLIVLRCVDSSAKIKP